MQIKSADLPGIGKKYSVTTKDGYLFVIIIHHTGKREIYFMNDDEDDGPILTLDLNDEEARKVGSILLGADYQPVSDEKLEIMRKNILVEWINLCPESKLTNMAIKDAQIRKITGATIIGIQRGDQVIGSPDVNEVLLDGDVLMVIGKKDQVKALEALCIKKE
ncbi:MAG: potassium transporter TrkA [Desulfitibacter sp. BRH_c19]|nr:MAG: potassium transporter TrkA [Desulfitibacter sp. BRH_c19]